MSLLTSLLLLALFDYYTWNGTTLGFIRIELGNAWHTIYKFAVWLVLHLVETIEGR